MSTLQSIVMPLLNIDVKSMISVLFWGNLISALLIVAFYISNPLVRDKVLSACCILAKLFQAFAYFLFFFRGQMPDILSVNLGNSLLFLGFYCEALLMLSMGRKKNRLYRYLIGGIVLFALIIFNLAEQIHPDSPGFRVAVASICVFLTLLVPTLRLLFARGISGFRRLLSIFYLLYLAMLLPRTVQALYLSIGVLDNSLVQVLTFLSLILLMIFNLSAYLVVMKENADKSILKLATTDALTGLANRHNFMAAASSLYKSHNEDKLPLTILFMDLDDFKKVNDTFGHGFGDEVLKRFAGLLRSKLRNEDLACRFGGEEFLALLPRADAKAAAIVSERILEETRAARFEQYPDFQFTVSIGIADGIPGDNESLEDFVDRADQALYQAKGAGKDQAVEYHG